MGSTRVVLAPLDSQLTLQRFPAMMSMNVSTTRHVVDPLGWRNAKTVMDLSDANVNVVMQDNHARM